MAFLALFFYFAVWCLVGTAIYLLLAPWVLVVYGVGTIAGLLIWAGARRRSTLNDKASRS